VFAVLSLLPMLLLGRRFSAPGHPTRFRLRLNIDRTAARNPTSPTELAIPDLSRFQKTRRRSTTHKRKQTAKSSTRSSLENLSLVLIIPLHAELNLVFFKRELAPEIDAPASL
jgi:hypothetical protein